LSIRSGLQRALSSRAPEAAEVARFTASMGEAIRVERGGRRRIERARARRLQAVLEAAQRTRLYGRELSDAAVREGRLDAVIPVAKRDFLEDVEATIPDGGVRRKDLLAHISDPARAGQLFRGRYIVAVTSGTTGQVGIFLNDVESWATARGLLFARIFRDRLKAGEIAKQLARGRWTMCFVVACGGHFMTHLLGTRMPKVGHLVSRAVTLSIELPIPALVDALNQEQPDVLHSYPTVLELLATEARLGNLRIDPDVITTGSETLTATCKAKLRAAFPKAKLVETYAATECVQLAASCAHGHLHVNEDAVILEPIDERGRVVAAGGRADRVLVTNLLNRAQPLLRYALTDQLVVERGACPCGSPMSRVRVFGRTDDTFYLQAEDGSWQSHPPIPFEVVFLKVPGLMQYQLVHEAQNRLRVLFAKEPGAAAHRIAGHIADRLDAYLVDHGLDAAVDYVIEEVDQIERHQASRKIRQITSRVPRPPGADIRGAQEVRERRRAPRGAT
jgi:phenylacetate-coenzyme A ligase PaaK-like adenylate-forming protein